MLIDLETQVRQSKNRWNRRQIERKSKSRRLELGKTATLCRCPKCDIRHETYMEWTGRGIPRIFCDACKPLAAGIQEIELHCGGPMMTKGNRKMSTHGLE